SGADAIGGFPRAVRGLDHRGATGRDREIADDHQLLGQRDTRLREAQDEILRRALPTERRPPHPRNLERCVPAPRTWPENHAATPSALPMPLSSTLIRVSRPNVCSLAVAHATARQRRSTRSWSYRAATFIAARARRSRSSAVTFSSSVVRRTASAVVMARSSGRDCGSSCMLVKDRKSVV